MFKTFILAIISTLCLVSCKDSNNTPTKKLVMGTSLDYPPFEYSQLGKPTGFDIDVAHALAKELNFNLEIRDISFDGLFGALNSSTVDFVMAGLSATTERKQNMDFSLPYHHADDFVLLIKKGHENNFHSLSGKHIGAQQGSLMESSLKSLPNIKILALGRNPQLIEELKLNRIDAILIGEPQAKAYVKANNNTLSLIPFPHNSSEGGLSIAFKKDSDLVESFDKALQKLKDNGTLDKLKSKWFN